MGLDGPSAAAGPSGGKQRGAEEVEVEEEEAGDQTGRSTISGR
jgi:hypothetical protein